MVCNWTRNPGRPKGRRFDSAPLLHLPFSRSRVGNSPVAQNVAFDSLKLVIRREDSHAKNLTDAAVNFKRIFIVRVIMEE